MQRLNLVGKVFGKLTVDGYSGIDSKKNTLWDCTCSCGKSRTVKGAELRNGRILSCGCEDARERDIVKKRFGRLVALRLDHIEGRRYFWLFQCDCGNRAIIDRSSVVTCNTKSCGCLIIEEATIRARKNVIIVKGDENG